MTGQELIESLQKLTPEQLALPVCLHEPEMGEYNEATIVECKKMGSHDGQVYTKNGEFKFVNEIITIW